MCKAYEKHVCLAIQQMREESTHSGRIEGAVLMCKDLGVSLAETIKRISEKFQLSESESSEAVRKYCRKITGYVFGQGASLIVSFYLTCDFS